jgi:outer membrane protein assembly factor BamB
MKNYKLTSIALIIAFVLVACAPLQNQTSITSNNFPLNKIWEKSTGDSIYEMAASDNMVFVTTSTNLIAIDTTNGIVLWTKKYQIDSDAQLLLSEDEIIITDSDQIILIDYSGVEVGRISLASKDGKAEFIALAGDYIFVLRRQAWLLEAYDRNKFSLVWSKYIDRGELQIYSNDESDIGYFLTLSDVSAVNLSNGEVLWKTPKHVRASSYDSGVLYLAETDQSEKNTDIVAYEASNALREQYRISFNNDLGEVLNLTILSHLLLVSTKTGIIAVDRNNTENIWVTNSTEEFFARPVELSNTIYAKASFLKTIIAVSPSDGSTIGTLKFGKTSLFSQTYYEYHSGIYTCGDFLLFFDEDMIYAFGE